MSCLLDAFSDWDRKAILVKRPTYTRPAGIKTVSWASSSLSVFVFQTAQVQKYLDSNISDEADYVIVCEASYDILKTDIVSFDSRYFEVLTPNNVGFQNEIQVIAIKERNGKPSGL